MAGPIPTKALIHAHSNRSTHISFLLPVADRFSPLPTILIPLNIRITPCPRVDPNVQTATKRTAQHLASAPHTSSSFISVPHRDIEYDHVPCSVFGPYCGMLDSFPLRQQYPVTRGRVDEDDRLCGQRLSGSAVQRPVDTVCGTGLNRATATNAVWVGGGSCHGAMVLRGRPCLGSVPHAATERA